MKPLKMLRALSLGLVTLIASTTMLVAEIPDAMWNKKGFPPKNLHIFWMTFQTAADWRDARERVKLVFGEFPIIFRGADERCVADGKAAEACFIALIVLDVGPLSIRDDVIRSPQAAVDITVASPLAAATRFRQIVQVGYLDEIRREMGWSGKRASEQ